MSSIATPAVPRRRLVGFGVRVRGRMFGFTEWLAAPYKDEFLQGGAETDLVRSGLEDMLRSKSETDDFRTAASYIALRRIADASWAIGA